MKPIVYLLDNFDSFTYNLVNELAMLDFELAIYRNNLDARYIADKMAQENRPVLLLLSPGPGAPKQAGCMAELISLCKGRYPILGICLGHQALIESYGGTIGHAGETVHGKTSEILMQDHPLFNGLPEKFNVARYHSLMATDVPSTVDVIATVDHIPMAVINEVDKVIGYQFHPESILTTHGTQLLKQSIDWLLAEAA